MVAPLQIFRQSEGRKPERRFDTQGQIKRACGKRGKAALGKIFSILLDFQQVVI
jgi:hypothetical protein